MNIDIKIKDFPLTTFFLTSKINDLILIENLKNDIKNLSGSNLDYKTNVKGKFTGFNSLNTNSNLQKFLILIRKEIGMVYKNNFNIKNSWGNICGKGDKVTRHNHDNNEGFCIILYLTDNGPGTYFHQHDILVKEEIGKYILFHPYLDHEVFEIKEDIERITLACNLEHFKEWDAEDINVTWIKK